MQAGDAIYGRVKNALIKDGWTITHVPYTRILGDLRIHADFAAEKLLAAERAEKKIAVEVKSFLGPSPVRDLEVALGQYQVYLAVLEQLDPGRKLYLAIDDKTGNNVFKRPAFELIVSRYQLSIVVVDVTA